MVHNNNSKGTTMKKAITCLLAVAFLYSGTAFADSYREVWQCKANDGKTQEEIEAVNSKWLAWMRKNVDKNVSSAILTSVVGNLEGFVFVDTYPSLDTWSKGRGAQDGNEEMDEINEAFNEVVTCSENSLMEYHPTP